VIAVLAVLVIALVVALLVWPLVAASRPGRRRAPGALAVGQPAAWTREVLQEEREAALEALRELDFDYALGKLAESDYRALRARLELRALTVLKALDELAAGERTSLAPPARHGEIMLLPPDAVAASYGERHRNGTRHPPSSHSLLMTAPVASQETATRGGRRWILAALLGSGALALAVGALYFGQAGLQGQQRAVATLDNVGPRALALVWREGAAAPRALLATATGLWTSDDGGTSWQPTPTLEQLLRGGATGAALRAVAVAPPRLYAAGATLLARSDDGGRTWSVVAPALALGEGAPTALDLRALAVDPDNVDRLWLVVEGAGVWRSDDGAVTWRQTSPQAPANATALVAVPGPADAPRAVGLFLASATEGVLASADQGRTWVPASGTLSGALPTRRVASLSFDPSSGESATTPDGHEWRGTLYAGTDQGLYKTVDRGQLWARLPLDANVAAVAAASGRQGSLLLAVDREGHVYRSESRGVRWDAR
jgi:photosystem II stability/assembly factor-like uncharacterized protein